MKEGWNIIIRYDESWRSTDVWFVKKQGYEEIVVLPINLAMTRSIAPSEKPPEPTLRFAGHESQQFLQGLTDALVQTGFKPDAVKVADERLLAISAHLEDMRSLVFNTPPKSEEKK